MNRSAQKKTNRFWKEASLIYARKKFLSNEKSSI
jgi:hypothetical protein